jgi:hypothetical protein
VAKKAGKWRRIKPTPFNLHLFQTCFLQLQDHFTIQILCWGRTTSLAVMFKPSPVHLLIFTIIALLLLVSIPYSSKAANIISKAPSVANSDGSSRSVSDTTSEIGRSSNATLGVTSYLLLLHLTVANKR